jgi:hypothetical protein
MYSRTVCMTHVGCWALRRAVGCAGMLVAIVCTVSAPFSHHPNHQLVCMLNTQRPAVPKFTRLSDLSDRMSATSSTLTPPTSALLGKCDSSCAPCQRQCLLVLTCCCLPFSPHCRAIVTSSASTLPTSPAARKCDSSSAPGPPVLTCCYAPFNPHLQGKSDVKYTDHSYTNHQPFPALTTNPCCVPCSALLLC